MKQKDVWDDFSTLPPEAQRQVIDLIAFLKTRFEKDRMVKQDTTKLTDESFIGMWQNREDMQDSAEWVRSVRKREW